MVDFNKLIGSVTGSGLGAGLAGGVAGGAVVSALSSKSGRKAAKSVAQIGGLAAVGALAWTAYRTYQGGGAVAQQVAAAQSSAPQPVESSTAWQQLTHREFEALGSDPAASQGLLVLRTMIAAAMADGHLGPGEQAHIFSQLDRLGLSAQEKSLLFDEMRNPQSYQALAAEVNDPVLAIELYTAAFMTVDSACPAAQEFLGGLSGGLKLPEPLVASIHSNASR